MNLKKEMIMLKTASPKKIIGSFFDALKPVSKMTVTQWAEKYRILSRKDSNEAGRYKVSRTPLLKDVMDALSADSPYQEIIVQKASQTGFTTAGLNWIGYTMHVDPAPMLYIMPSKDLLKKTSQTRIDPLISDTPEIGERVVSKETKEGGNTLFEKHFDDGFLSLGSAETANTGRSTPYKKIFIDELSKFKSNISGEGNWYKLLKGRTKTFKHSYKIFAISTPGVKGDCPLTQEFEKTDQRFAQVPCPHCGTYQVLVWEKIIWDRLDDGKPDLKSVHYECCECKGKILEHHKTEMFEKHKWVPTATPENPKMIGFNFSSLYCSVGMYSWSDMVQDFYEAKKDKNEMIAFVNTALGKPWAERSENTPPWQSLYNRREDYPKDTVPFKSMILIGSADVQKNRIEVGIFAIAKRKESTTCEVWTMDHIVLNGDTSTDPNESHYVDKHGNELETPWYKLRKLLQRRFKWDGSAKGDKGLPLSCFAIDCGYESQNVYVFADSYHPEFMYAVFGDPNKDDYNKRAINNPTRREINKRGTRVDSALRIWPLGVSTLKEYVYQRLSLSKGRDGESPSSYVHFSKDLEEETFKQLTAEDLIIEENPKTGFTKTKWHKNRRYNEYLDITAYMLAMIQIKQYDRIEFEDWVESSANINEELGGYLDSIS